MSLPLTLTVTRMELDFHLVVAFHSSSSRPSPSAAASAPSSRVYLSILDELDPSGPPLPQSSPAAHPAQHGTKPPPIGQRILPSMQIESSIGQDGEHVLRNVAKVERFVVDLLRSAIVDELVYPNFHTVLVG